jgi:ankyrin repeat protein
LFINIAAAMIAIARKAERALEWLLDRGLDPTFVSVRGDTALGLACSQGDTTAVKILCDRMDDIEIPETDEHSSSIARWAVLSKNLDILRMVLKKGCDVNRYDASGEQPADAIRGALDDATGLKMLQMLIEFGYDIHGRDPRDRKAFLDRVVEFTVGRYPKIVEFLLSKGADPRVRFGPGTCTLESVKGWRADSRYSMGIKQRYVEIFTRYFPEEFQ